MNTVSRLLQTNNSRILFHKKSPLRTLLEKLCLQLVLRSKYQEYQGRIVVVCASTALCVELYFTQTFLGKQNETTYESSFKSSLSDFGSFMITWSAWSSHVFSKPESTNLQKKITKIFLFCLRGWKVSFLTIWYSKIPKYAENDYTLFRFPRNVSVKPISTHSVR